MRLLLCSDYSGVGYKYLDLFFEETKGLNCLFVGYAQDDPEELESFGAQRFKKAGINVIGLSEGYDFSDKIDIIFVRGGNTTRLIHYLKEYNQFEKIKELVEKQNVLYIGSSAGAVLAGSDTEYCLRSEPYDFDVKSKFGDDALKGYGWIDKMVFVHTTKYCIDRPEVMKHDDDVFVTLDTFCYPAHLEEIEIYDKSEYIEIGNDQALLIDGEKKNLLTDDWSKYQIRILEKGNKI